ncbi:hypothetical protein BJ944DRAFT_254577 [Cunninghamella echinulata]|nr:hypothetical protein BJ944DRAFT_254577 [Cunninghamella echinulata]
MDGIAYSCKDRSERMIIESSGETDNEHTVEDTLKLMEFTSRCLKDEMNQYLPSSWSTFEKRKVFAIQFVSNKITLLATKHTGKNKWSFIVQRSAIIPRDWDDRFYWVEVIELLMKLRELLIEQEEVTLELKQQKVGLIKVKPNDTIRYNINDIQ